MAFVEDQIRAEGGARAHRCVRVSYTSKVEAAEDAAAQLKLEQLVGVELQFAPDTQPVPGPGLIAGIPGIQDVHVQTVRLYNPAAGGTPAMQELDAAQDAATSHTATALGPGHSRDLLAPGAPALNDVTYLGTAAVEVPVPFPHVRLSGAALGAWGAVAPTAVPATIEFHSGPPRSHAEFGTFVDDVIDTLPSIENTARELLRQLQLSSAGGYTVTSGSATQTTVGAAYTAVAPTGEVWVRNSQIGSNPNQIPPSAAQNTPERYAFHPAVFLRRPALAVLLERVGPVREQPITASRGVLAIWQVVRAPTHSRWGIILDGVPRVVIVAHPQGTDLRTPREIWAGVWLPFLETQGQTSLPIYELTGTGFVPVGALSRGAAQQLDYARFLEPLDGQTTPIVNLFAQSP